MQLSSKMRKKRANICRRMLFKVINDETNVPADASDVPAKESFIL